MAKKTKWTIAIPLQGIRLYPTNIDEFPIRRVTLIRYDKMIRLRGRLGIQGNSLHNNGSSVLRHMKPRTDQVHAVISHYGDRDQVVEFVKSVVTDELNLFAVSMLGGYRRDRRNYIGVADVTGLLASKTLTFDHDGILNHQKFETLRNSRTVNVDGLWNNRVKDNGFLKLMRILNDKVNMESKWKDSLLRAAKLIGKSTTMQDKELAFITNVAALEVMCTGVRNHKSSALAAVAEYLLGWSKINPENYKSLMTKLYDARSRYLHGDAKSSITADSLVISDVVVHNIFINLVNASSWIKSRNDLIDAVNKHEARMVLGLRREKSRGVFRFWTSSYSQNELSEI